MLNKTRSYLEKQSFLSHLFLNTLVPQLPCAANIYIARGDKTKTGSTTLLRLSCKCERDSANKLLGSINYFRKHLA